MGPGASGGPGNLEFCVFVYLYIVVVGEKNLEAGTAGEGVKWQKGLRKILPTCPPPPPGCSPLHTLPPLPLHLLLIIIVLLLLLNILLLLFKEVWKASRPSLLSSRDL